MREIKYRVTQKDQQLLVLPVKRTCKWLVAGFYHDAIPDPLPELGLRRPELSPVTTDHQRGLALLLFLLVLVFPGVHILPNTRVTLHGISCRRRKQVDVQEATHSTPKGSLMCKAASGFQSGADFGRRYLHQQSRYQFCSSLYSKLDENVAQMKLDGLLANPEAASDLRIRKALDTTKCHLRLAAT